MSELGRTQADESDEEGQSPPHGKTVQFVWPLHSAFRLAEMTDFERVRSGRQITCESGDSHPFGPTELGGNKK